MPFKGSRGFSGISENTPKASKVPQVCLAIPESPVNFCPFPLYLVVFQFSDLFQLKRLVKTESCTTEKNEVLISRVAVVVRKDCRQGSSSGLLAASSSLLASESNTYSQSTKRWFHSKRFFRVSGCSHNLSCVTLGKSLHFHEHWFRL